MYKVFIVDDEALIRDGLKQIIDWEALGFTVCGEASNGEDAEKEILEKQPDLTLMDIRMPRKPGLDVVASVREKDFKGRFIILSGYSDFKYAQEAIRYGVEFYLTKPIDEDELLLFLCDEHHGNLNEEQRSLARRCRDEMRTAYSAAVFRLMLYEEMLNRGMAADIQTCRSIFSPEGGDAPWLPNRAV